MSFLEGAILDIASEFEHLEFNIKLKKVGEPECKMTIIVRKTQEHGEQNTAEKEEHEQDKPKISADKGWKVLLANFVETVAGGRKEDKGLAAEYEGVAGAVGKEEDAAGAVGKEKAAKKGEVGKKKKVGLEKRKTFSGAVREMENAVGPIRVRVPTADGWSYQAPLWLKNNFILKARGGSAPGQKRGSGAGTDRGGNKKYGGPRRQGLTGYASEEPVAGPSREPESLVGLAHVAKKVKTTDTKGKKGKAAEDKGNKSGSAAAKATPAKKATVGGVAAQGQQAALETGVEAQDFSFLYNEGAEYIRHALNRHITKKD